LYLDVTRKTFELRYHKEIEEQLGTVQPQCEAGSGVDFSDMCGIVTAQPRGNYLYGLKEFHTLVLRMKYNWVKKFRNFTIIKIRSWIGTMTAQGTRTVKPNEIGHA
jgi:hypothetical protein